MVLLLQKSSVLALGSSRNDVFVKESKFLVSGTLFLYQPKDS